MSKTAKSALLAFVIVITCLAVYTAAGLFTAEIVLEVSENDRTVEVFSSYVPESVTAMVRFPLFFGATSDIDVTADGAVTSDKPGENTVIYKAKFLNKSVEQGVTVRVVDTVPPAVTVNEDFIEISADELPLDPEKVTVSASAVDNYDGDITEKIVKTVEGNVCYYTATDSSGNSAKAEIKLIIQDDRGPELKLKGNSTVYMPINTSYKELGYTVKDNYDENIASKVKITSNVNINKRGTYAVTYSVTDEAGNTSSLTRRVIVYGGEYSGEYDTVKPNGKVIYLTFDDGPSIYTETLLETLKKYNVKATFFVTNQKPKYQYLIGQMHREGHTVGLHTLTHQWTIYKSVDAYLADFNAMNAIIEEQTGSPTRIFRFPGGTNNAVSKSHCKGIMTTLSQMMVESGYTYFDWNVSSSDTTLTDPSDIINTLVNQVSKKTRSVILAHDIKSATVKAMPGFIEYCLKNGYTFKAITEDTEPVRFKPKN